MKNHVNKIVGVQNGEIYCLDYVFESTMHGEPFRGATGSIFVPVSKEECERRSTAEFVNTTYDLELTEDEVYQNITEEQAFFGHDTSDLHIYFEQLKSLYPDAYTFECIGGGRCFEADMQFEQIVNPELLKIINKHEK